jgi:hypothetical protein
VDALVPIDPGISKSTLSFAQTLGEDMNSSGVGSFTKQAACPSSKTMLSYCSAKLSPEIKKLVTWHLSECDFCAAEVQLLAHHAQPRKEQCRPPAMPANLRLLAETLLHHRGQPRQIKN